MSIFLAMYGNKVSISEALFISLFAMIVVFVVLLIISYLIDVTAFFINGSNKVKNINEVKIDTNTEKNIGIESSVNDDGKLVAIIAAAIAEYLGTSSNNIRITKIRRKRSMPWNK